MRSAFVRIPLTTLLFNILVVAIAVVPIQASAQTRSSAEPDESAAETSNDDQIPTGQFDASKMAEFKSSQGFSIRYPEGWFIATKETQDQMKSELKEALGKIGNVDWNRMAVVIVGPLDDDKIESVNVVVAPMRLDLDTLDPDRFAKTCARTLGRLLGLTPTNVSGSVAEYGGNSGVSVHLDVRTPTEVVHQWTVFVPGRTQTYIVTCTCGETERKKYEPIFRAMLDSLRVDVNNRK